MLQLRNVAIGEDSVFSVTAKTTNKTIENAMMVSRGITVFNKVQDAAQIKPTKFLPHVLSIFTNIENIYNNEEFGTIIRLRYRDPKKMSSTFTSKDDIKEGEMNDRKEAESKNNNNNDKKEYVWNKRSEINNNLSENMFKVSSVVLLHHGSVSPLYHIFF